MLQHRWFRAVMQKFAGRTEGSYWWTSEASTEHSLMAGELSNLSYFITTTEPNSVRVVRQSVLSILRIRLPLNSGSLLNLLRVPPRNCFPKSLQLGTRWARWCLAQIVRFESHMVRLRINRMCSSSGLLPIKLNSRLAAVRNALFDLMVS